MERTKLSMRVLPSYTKGEEIFNMISHIVGGALGITALVLCVVFAAVRGDAWGVVSGALYGASFVILYTMSSIYHGLHDCMGKRVLQVLDHCSIYFLIGGSYTPILLVAIRRNYPGWAWAIFGVVWGFAALATTFTAIDLKKYQKLSMACYIGMGWCIAIAVRPTIASLDLGGLLWLLGGGIAYTIGAVLYGIGKKHKYMHSVFHMFVLAGSIMHFFCIFFHVILA